MADVMDEVPSDKLQEIFGYFDSAPYPRRWPKGETIQSEPFRARQFRITNLDWGIRVQWHVNDREDDQTHSLFQRARDAGAHWATLPERVFFQIIQGTADPDLLPSIPNASDGAPIYSATDGDGNPRFGVTGGNTLTATGFSNAAQIRQDFYRAFTRMLQFRDTKGQPLWDRDRILANGLIIFFNVANEQLFAEAFIQSRTVQVIQNVAGTENVAAAAVTNVVLESGLSVMLAPTPRITTNAWFVFARGVTRKPVVRTIRQPLREVVATFENSDHARNTKEEYIQWDSREGYGVNLPYQTVRIQ
jgi:hypothetical protein